MSEECAVVFLSVASEAELIQRALHSFGVGAQVAESARQLGALVERHAPVFLVLDGPLAERSGVEPLRWLRRGGLDIPAIFLCASSYECEALGGVTDLRPLLACRELTREVMSGVLVRLRMADDETDMAASGSLDDADVTDLLLWSLRMRWTGRLVLESGGISKTIFIRSGMPVYCSSNILSENFGRLLLKRGIISEDDYERARALQLKERIRQGEALIRLGVLKSEELEGYLRDQVEEKLLNAIAWSGGTYALEEGDEFSTSITPATLNPIALLIDGERRFRTKREAEERWPRMRALWAAARGDRPEVAALVHGVITRALRQELREPRLLAKLASEQRWDPREAVSVFSILERAGYIAVAERPEMLPAIGAGVDGGAGTPPPQSSARGQATAEVPRPVELSAAEEHTLLEELYETYFRTASASAFRLLGVERTAPPEHIVRSRDDLLRRFSKDRFAPVLAEPKHRKALERLRGRIEEAASTLLNPKRHQFSRAETSQTRTTREVSMKKLVQAEEEFQQGLSLMPDDARAALPHFAAAADYNPKDPLYLLHHGWVRFLCAATPGERNRGHEMIKRAVGANPIMPEGQLILARVLKAEGRVAEAVERARTALAFEPDSKDVIEFLDTLGAPVRPTRR